MMVAEDNKLSRLAAWSVSQSSLVDKSDDSRIIAVVRSIFTIRQCSERESLCMLPNIAPSPSLPRSDLPAAAVRSFGSWLAPQGSLGTMVTDMLRAIRCNYPPRPDIDMAPH